VGCSTAYFLTRHALYNPKIYSVVLLEASRIASGAYGKGGGFIADWATPRCLAPLSFRLHTELAKEHAGDKIWGHRFVYAAEVKLQGQNLGDDKSNSSSVSSQTRSYPSALDWLLPENVKEYKEIGTPKNSGQINPFMFSTTLAQLAEEKGAKIVIGSATAVNYNDSDGGVESVTYVHNGELITLEATDVLLAAGPWTTRLLPSVKLLAPKGHSVIVRPTRDLSPYILFPSIEPAPNSNFKKLLSPDIYPRPADDVHEFDTVYSSGPDDYDDPLPSGTEAVKVEDQKCEDVLTAMKSVSREIHDGKVLTKQACYKAQIRKHGEDEEVGPMVGPMGIKGLWLATGFDEWGIQNAPGAGFVMSEMILEGAARSADVEFLDPKHWLNMSSML
jgi:glycine/D-amino acid oxidase-like deaminating enzyme